MVVDRPGTAPGFSPCRGDVLLLDDQPRRSDGRVRVAQAVERRDAARFKLSRRVENKEQRTKEAVSYRVFVLCSLFCRAGGGTWTRTRNTQLMRLMLFRVRLCREGTLPSLGPLASLELASCCLQDSRTSACA
jgi:hypothetical protein